MAKISRWRVEGDLDPTGPLASIGATRRSCGLTLRPQPPLVVPLDGFLVV